MLFDFNSGDDFLWESLSLDSNGNSINSIEKADVVDEIIIERLGVVLRRQDTFRGLSRELESNGYEVVDTYLYFPYDWRLDFDMTKSDLDYVIETIKQNSGYDTIDIIAHSMGGLVIKNYIHEHGPQSINKLIFVGTPHLGAPKSAYGLLQGDIGVPFRLLNYEAIRKIAINSPPVYQLLPNDFYHSIGSGYFRKNREILDYNQSLDLLKEQEMNSLLIDRANEFFARELHGMMMPGTQVYNISGCRRATHGMYHTDNPGNIYSISYINGDGTVPLLSSQYELNSNANKYYVRNGSHSELPSTSGVRELILSILNDEEFSSNNISTNTGFCNLTGRKLIWRSPVEVQVYDVDSNHAGPTENEFENNIPGVEYDIINGEKFIFLPLGDGQVYRVEAKGLETGSFDLLITDYNNVEGETRLFDNIEIVSNSFVTFTVSDDSSNDSIEFDLNNSGNRQLLHAALFASENKAFIEAMNDSEPDLEPRPEPQPAPISSGGGLPPAPPDDTKSEENGKILGEATAKISDGTLVLDTSDGRTVYMIGNQGRKYGFTTPKVFLGQGFKFENVIRADINNYELGGIIADPSQAHPNGTLVRDGNTIWLINNELRSRISKGSDMRNLVKANKEDLKIKIK